MEWRRFVTYLWNDPRIINQSTNQPITEQALAQSTKLRDKNLTRIADDD